MELKQFCYDGKEKFSQKKFNTGAAPGAKDKEESVRRLAKNTARIEELQNKLYAEGKQSLLVVLQAMDAAGKDGTIKHVFSGVNPEGIVVSNFKQPSSTELAHDYLWRVHQKTPARGMIGIFNRSHYESVLIEKVLDLPKTENLPDHLLKGDIWKARYRQIRDFERLLNENGTTIVKFYLNISKAEQDRRFLSRLDTPAKNWKFSVGDMKTSEHWDDYMRAFEDCVNNTSAPGAPWYVVPADKKWYARLLVSEVVVKTLEKMDPRYPKVSAQERKDMEASRPILEKAVQKGK